MKTCAKACTSLSDSNSDAISWNNTSEKDWS